MEMAPAQQQELQPGGGEEPRRRRPWRAARLSCSRASTAAARLPQVKLLEQRFVELGKKVKVFRFPGAFEFRSPRHFVVGVCCLWVANVCR